MSEFLFFLSAVLVVSFISIFIIRLKNKNLQLLLILTQAIQDIEKFKDKFGNEELSVEQQHLITFLNDTRDIAYKYIEDMHKALLEFKSEIEFDLLHPNDMSVPRIKKAFEKLQSVYPQDIPND